VIKGYGNNSQHNGEGAVYKHCFGTYLHGPVLPKNPKFADHLLLAAMKRKYDIEKIDELDDTLEDAAAMVAAERPQ
ncbi:MAG TPA: glutamine amidotransferase, partial [Candidatus Nanoarchaeia archaeon]|nr:glutamine amidotransferase [Candidatus Nanoarchaeia archaeon]